jgi:hypothetical protein
VLLRNDSSICVHWFGLHVVDAISCVLFDSFLIFCSILYVDQYERFLKFLFVQFLTFINVFMGVM